MLILFFWYGLISVACATGNGHRLSQSQIGYYSSQQLHHENRNQQINPQFSSHTSNAEDRSLYAHKYRMKRKKRKYKLFKKHFKKCGGDPFNFKFIKRADDDPDTISIKLPYGFGDEYYPEGIQRNDESDFNGLDDDSDENDDEEFEEFTQRLKPVRSLRPVYPRISAHKPNRLVPQRVFLRHKPWIPLTPWNTSISKESMVGAFHHGAIQPKSPVRTLETPTEKGKSVPNYVYQSVKLEVEPKRRFSQPAFYTFYKTSTNGNESGTDEEEKVVTVTPITPHYDDSWMPVLESSNENYRRVFSITNEPEIITAKMENQFLFRKYNRTIKR